MFCVFPGNFHVYGYFHTEIMQDRPCPYLLDRIFVFLGMEGFQAQGIFQVTVGSLLIPPHMVQIPEIIQAELQVGKVGNKVFKGPAGKLEADHPQGHMVFRAFRGNIIHGDIPADVTVLVRQFRVEPFLSGH